MSCALCTEEEKKIDRDSNIEAEKKHIAPRKKMKDLRHMEKP